MSSTGKLQIGDRIQHKDSRGTIRYIGTVEGHGAKQWVGVEWDDASRGKHSGTHDGRTYFACAAGTGSFVKLDRLGSGGRTSLLEAVKKRYAEDALDTTFRESLVVVGGGLVSIEDCDEKRRREVAFAGLRVVDVSGMGVACVKEEGLSRMLPEVRELRIARSLFSGIGCVLEALEAFPRLKVLDVSRNVLEESSDSGVNAVSASVGKSAEELEEVVMNHCAVSWKTVGRVCELSGKLETLRLHNCKLGSMDEELQLTNKLRMVQTLDLDRNEVKWDDVTQCIGKLENLREVYLSNNKLCDKELGPEECLTKVETLSLAHNALDGWKVITWLHKLGELKNLRIRGNPVTSEEEDDRETRLTWRMRVIGRIGGIQVLDGSAVSVDERILCEKRYMNEEIGSGWVVNSDETRREHPRAEELYNMYGLSTRKGRDGSIRGSMIRVRLVAGEKVGGYRKSVVRDMPQGAGMSRVRAVGRRLLGIEEECRVGVMNADHVEWENDLSHTLAFWSDASHDFAVNSNDPQLCVVIGGATVRT